jgi:membrane fusion protein, heavy metal efflux system
MRSLALPVSIEAMPNLEDNVLSTSDTGHARKWLERSAVIFCFWLSCSGPGLADLDDLTSSEPGAQSEQIRLNGTGQKALDIKVETVENKRITPELTVPGRVEIAPNRSFRIHTLQEGRICRIFVTLGQAVKQGQTLAWVDSAEINRIAAEALQSRAQIQAELAQTKTTLDDEVIQAESRHKLAKVNFERVKQIVDEGIGAKKELHQATSELEVALTRFAAAQRKREQVLLALNERLRLTIEPLRQRLVLLGLSESGIDEILKTKKTVVCVPIRSSHDGKVVAISTTLGQSVSPADGLFAVADLSRVWVTAQIYESEVARIYEGQEAAVKLPSLPGRTFQGQLSYVSTSVDPVGRTLPVAVELENKDGKLKVGMYAEVHIRASASQALPIVPWEAIVQREKNNYVLLESKGSFKPVQVRLGHSFDHQVEIREGVNAGDRIVTEGAFQLEGALVSSGAKTAVIGNDVVQTGVRESFTKGPTKWWPRLEVLIGIVLGFFAGFLFLWVFQKGQRNTSRQVQASSQSSTNTSGVVAIDSDNKVESKI